ncbi:AAA family ATPase [Oxalobacteraceae bacterium]|nr:AAA family ATPase [Oxalobacteraceae bacterium]
MRPILSPQEALDVLTYLPRMPEDVANIPRHIRLHHLQMLRELHVVSREEAKLADTFDLMIRSNYHHLDPQQPSTWSSLRGEGFGARPKPPAMSALITGLPGTGKTSAIRNTLSTYEQVIFHESFPQASRPLKQVVWMSCDVPASGRSADLASTLMYEWNRLCKSSRFEHLLGLNRRKGSVMLEEWQQAASAQFLGLLHLDEIQNLFRLPALAKRRNKTKNEDEIELSIVEDECLKFFFNMYNTGRFALAYSGTPDGMYALTKRLATTQRFTTGGAHQFRHFEDPNESDFRRLLLPELMRYQFVAKPLELNDSFAELILELSGGIFRIIIALWVAAHRIAFERTKSDELRITDFKKAADTYLAPLGPAIKALRSRDPVQMRRFSDLAYQDDAFWASIWQR